MQPRTSVLEISLVAVMVVLALSGQTVGAVGTIKVEVKFVTFTEAGLPEQDVFIESKTDPKMVVRVEGNDAKDPANLAKIVFSTAIATPHDPSKSGPNPLGPFPKGNALGFTLQQWLSATGTGTYTTDGDDAEISLSLQKYVPNGVYTVWCRRITLPSLQLSDIPCGAEDGSQNVFRADAQGNGVFNVKLKALQDFGALLATAYHSDGKTYGSVPGDFGRVTHVQHIFNIPPLVKLLQGTLNDKDSQIASLRASLQDKDTELTNVRQQLSQSQLIGYVAAGVAAILLIVTGLFAKKGRMKATKTS